MVEINVGTAPNSGDGSPLRQSWIEQNANNQELLSMINERLITGQDIPLNTVTGLETILSGLTTRIENIELALPNKANNTDVMNSLNTLSSTISDLAALIQQQQGTITVQQDTINYILSIIQ